MSKQVAWHYIYAATNVDIHLFIYSNVYAFFIRFAVRMSLSLYIFLSTKMMMKEKITYPICILDFGSHSALKSIWHVLSEQFAFKRNQNYPQQMQFIHVQNLIR